MAASLVLVSLLAVAQSLELKKTYHYIATELLWTDAQAYCKLHYYDLATVESQAEQKALEKSAGLNPYSGFFGLHRDVNDLNGWKWSGGEAVTYSNWNGGEPNNGHAFGEYYVMVTGTGGWNDVPPTAMLPFYCMETPVAPPFEEVLEGWEEAEGHCRGSGTNLISLRSEGELLSVLNLMVQEGHDRIWIGLRFLAGGWFWVNGDPLVFQAWSEGAPDLQCPPLGHCAAMAVDGRWVTADCEERLHFACN